MYKELVMRVEWAKESDIDQPFLAEKGWLMVYH